MIDLRTAEAFVGPSWAPVLLPVMTTDAFVNMAKRVSTERKEHEVYPAPGDVFKAYKMSSFEDTRVVILGQDPYHTPGMAHGLAFSVPEGAGRPPSLVNIFKELAEDVGVERTSTDLTGWAREGVLLLNIALTVRKGEAASHAKIGWGPLIRSTIEALSLKPSPVVFILWGKHAQRADPLINPFDNWVIRSPHPSPFSARSGFFGSRPFSKANGFLEKDGLSPIDWSA